MSVEFILGHLNYWFVIILMMAGLYTIVARGNYVKKMVGLSVFQASVFMFYISVSKVADGSPPIYPLDLNVDPNIAYSNPLPHVLILTAIVVGVATTALGLSLIIRIREEYGTIEEEEILEIERKMQTRENKEQGSAMGGRA